MTKQMAALRLLGVFMALVGCCLTAVAGSSGHNSIRGRVVPPENVNVIDFFLATKVLLDGGAHVTFLAKDGTFELTGIPSASYLLEVVHPDFSFNAYRVDVDDRFDFGARVFQADPVGGLPPVKVTYDEDVGLRVPTTSRTSYFEPRKPWNIMELLMNPMILMALLPMALMYLMPSKETMEEMQKELRQETGHEPMANNLANFSLAESLASLTGNQQNGEAQPARKNRKKASQ
ncbi:uncharacterized protein MONBRDRAFT_33849 [Monosiga brevicollis MX1]|uniref:ER membrane protein complex subunit 7 beta-sandwich domain-containing protein n=1 Tax=Monosiga brevicollis TaxID=81824 RepID=A9V7X0_MONBE|nr:uncharacterized protein MONBRDRAFT_33849 [Monosiga brevicollis MX1]EDQ86450.1 predicted protein [Monosiga brevicollis MX1]|eukprot:XP_001748840.1 hypothetical protein [Monosiga brevicollis MX1]